MTPATSSLDLSSPSFTIGASAPPTDSSSLLFTRPTARPALKNPLRVSAERMSKELTKEMTPSEEKRLQIMKLKKRFLKSKEMTSSFIAKSKARSKILQEVSGVSTSW